MDCHLVNTHYVYMKQEMCHMAVQVVEMFLVQESQRRFSASKVMSSLVPFDPDLVITTTEMHTGGEPLRIIENGFPKPEGTTLLDKRAWLCQNADKYRRLLMFEPRGHYDMYGALLVEPDLPGADVAVIFMHNEGYSTMCGHGVIALGRYVVDRNLVQPSPPETRVVIQCPCGLVTSHVLWEKGSSGRVRFESVPSYVFALDVPVLVPELGEIKVDISYGGAFYAFVAARVLDLDLHSCPVSKLAAIAQSVTDALKKSVKLCHPESSDLAFIYGTIVTDGDDGLDETDKYTAASTVTTSTQVCVFANREVDRSPCGSGVSARVALQYYRHILSLGQTRHFRSGVTGAEFTGKALREVDVKGAGPDGTDTRGVVTEVAGNAYYTGKSVFTVDIGDPQVNGFLVE